MNTDASPTLAASEPRDTNRSDALLALRDTYVSNAVSHSTRIVADHARGAELWDVDGRRYIDFAGGIGTLNIGHAHPAVVEAMTTQAHKLTHTMFGVTLYESYILLAEQLAHLTPGAFAKKSVLVNSGAEAVENAIKIARAATGRPRVIAFSNAFHGRTALTMALTHKERPYKLGFGPLPEADIIRLPQPWLYRPAFPDGEVQGCLDALAHALDTHAGEVAAIIFEPVQGEGGFIPAPDVWMRGVADLARQHDVVLIADEIQTGFGRTGRWFAVEHAGIEPDLVVMAKSLAGGMPLGAVTGRAALMDAPNVGGLGGTFGGNPVACAAALAVIQTMRADGIIGRAVELGRQVRARFDAWQQELPIIGDVRGLGAMQALELVRDRTTKTPADTETGMVIQHAAREGLILIRAGTLDNVIRILTPLVASQAQVDEGLDILGDALRTVATR